MHVKEGVVYNEHSCELVGVCDLGEINNHLISIEKEYWTHETAKTTSIDNDGANGEIYLYFPYASFAASNLTGEQLSSSYFLWSSFLSWELWLKVTFITIEEIL